MAVAEKHVPGKKTRDYAGGYAALLRHNATPDRSKCSGGSCLLRNDAPVVLPFGINIATARDVDSMSAVYSSCQEAIRGRFSGVWSSCAIYQMTFGYR